MAYVKLFGSILHSTIWREPDSTRLVWITLLALADRDGVVEASVPGLADAARVTIEECQVALTKFSQPDEWSRTQDYEGRRIEPVPGGWRLLNYDYYRLKSDSEDKRAKNAARQRRYREKRKDVTQSNAGDDLCKKSRHRSDRIGSDRNGSDRIGSQVVDAPAERKRKHRLPDDFAPNEGHHSLAAELRVDLSKEFPQFRDHHQAKGTTMLKWDLALRTWIRNAAKWSAKAPSRRAEATEFMGRQHERYLQAKAEEEAAEARERGMV